ncbi:MAG: hypothetical protein A3G75_09585 [Verrucomicrobia bacterium RIFCSPLOWO2_12_FULL_64_8]|nr:MAG: hypothetical protein A3G75_09585 [Verrucomicrobia bacterium RIFCSPLOWO2_12_FULL_64_8]
MITNLKIQIRLARLFTVLLVVFPSPGLLRAVSPIAISGILMNGDFACFTNRLHPGNKIGYRFHEHRPFVFGEVPVKDTTTDAAMKLLSEFKRRDGVFTNTREIKETDGGWVPQTWAFYLHPVEDGIEILWVISTKDAGLSEFFAVQQCFRLSGSTNEEWRHEIAEAPAFSEYDLWAKQDATGSAHTSLSWVLRQGA